MIAENLLVSKAWVDEGPTLRRFRPRAYGRATQGPQAHVARDGRGGDDGRRGVVGQKIHPYGFRLGVIYPWKSNWYASRRDYIEALHEDVWIRKHIRARLSRAGISSIDIERKGDQIWVYIRTARPGIVIGRKGAEVDRLRKDVERYTKKRVDVKVEDMNQASSEVRPDTDAALLAQGVAEQLAGRVAFRRAMRRAVQTAMRAGRARRARRVRAGASAARTWAARSGTARAGCRCTRSARRWTSAPPPRRRRSARSA